MPQPRMRGAPRAGPRERPGAEGEERDAGDDRRVPRREPERAARRAPGQLLTRSAHSPFLPPAAEGGREKDEGARPENRPGPFGSPVARDGAPIAGPRRRTHESPGQAFLVVS